MLYQGPWYLSQVSWTGLEMVARFSQESHSSHESMAIRQG